MEIKLNGKTVITDPQPSLLHLVNQFCNGQSKIIAELNGDIIKPEQWNSTKINDGDAIELLNFVGGGNI